MEHSVNMMLVSKLGLKPDALQGETVLVTGAGGGIGYEAARALLWLGANVVIAEIDSEKGSGAAEQLGAEFDPQRVAFIHTDVGDQASVQELHRECIQRFGKVDAAINNATIAVLGEVKDLPIEKWDASYRVNLRGPVLMAQAFLPDMISRHHGVFVCVSSTGTAYLGGYETFKAAQVHLANTLDAELEGTGVIAFTIGPGLVPTETASNAVGRLAPLMGMTVEQFFEMNKNAVLTPEEAGTGFAVSIVLAEKFKGMEISSMQALKAADINYGASEEGRSSFQVAAEHRKQARGLCGKVRITLKEQSEEWKRRSLFERQWVIRDFKKTAGMRVDEWLAALERLESSLQGDSDIAKTPLNQLSKYYDHLAELAKGY
jgi:NAD(P)-dependent dehydrogenase (short-subunit alcohol dehydrogenase family)